MRKNPVKEIKKISKALREDKGSSQLGKRLNVKEMITKLKTIKGR